MTQECTHPETHIRVLGTVGTCETTVTVCSSCGVELTNPKIDCT
ncbi:hypothetical protein [Flavobacterium beibuense]